MPVVSGLLPKLLQLNAPKEKESVLGLIKSLSVLRSKFGKVHVNLGEPIVLDELLDGRNPHWRGAPAAAGANEDASPPGWIAELISDLASRITSGINGDDDEQTLTAASGSDAHTKSPPFGLMTCPVV